jgi:hypothetical protein
VDYFALKKIKEPQNNKTMIHLNITVSLINNHPHSKTNSSMKKNYNINPCYIKHYEITPQNKNYYVFKYITRNLDKIDKDMNWLLTQVGIKPSEFKMVINGRQNIGMENLYNMAVVFKNMKTGIITPKQLMNMRNISLKYFKDVRNNIRYLKNKYSITNAEIIENTGIHGGNLSLLLRNKFLNPQHNTLSVLYKFFLYKGIYLESPLDLIYFPKWGEDETTYQKYHRIKEMAKARRIPKTIIYTK